MSNLTPRGRYTPRRQREQRAYLAVVVGGTAAAVAVVGVVLAIAGVIGGGLPVAAAIVAAICFVIFRSAVSARYSSIARSDSAIATACARVLAPSLRMPFLMCVRTVCGLTNRISPISSVE